MDAALLPTPKGPCISDDTTHMGDVKLAISTEVLSRSKHLGRESQEQCAGPSVQTHMKAV